MFRYIEIRTSRHTVGNNWLRLCQFYYYFNKIKSYFLTHTLMDQMRLFQCPSVYLYTTLTWVPFLIKKYSRNWRQIFYNSFRVHVFDISTIGPFYCLYYSLLDYREFWRKKYYQMFQNSHTLEEIKFPT